MRVVPLGFETVAEAEAFDVQKLDLGSTCYVDAIDSFFDYRESTDTPDGVNVLSCTGIDGVRWLLRAGGGGSGSLPSNTVVVSTSGNDDHNGVTAPVKTLKRAAELIQIMHGGTVLAEDFVWSSDISGGGLKLRNPLTDRGIGGAGWVDLQYPITFDFGGNPERQSLGWGASYIAPGAGAGRHTEPVLWLAGTQTSVVFKNAQFWSDATSNVPTVRIGLSSPLAVWDSGTTYFANSAVTYLGVPYCSLQGSNLNHQPDISGTFWRIARAPSVYDDGLAPIDTTMAQFDDCQFVRLRHDAGPALDVGLGYWNYYNGCLFAKFDFGSDPGTDNPELNCAVRMMATARGAPYLQYFTNVRFDGAGIYTTGNSAAVINGGSMENAIFPLLTCLDDVDVNSTSTALRWDIFNCDISDGPFGEERVCVNDSNGVVYATRCNKSFGRTVEINPLAPNIEPTDRFTYGQSGPTLLLQHDSARRGYGPVSSKYPNVAWGAPTGATLMAAPDGTTTAFASGAVTHTLFDGTTAPQTLVDGDRLIFGIWNRWDTGGGGINNYVQNTGAGAITIFVGGFVQGGNQQKTLQPGEFYRWLGDVPSSLGQWAWSWAWLKVVTKGTGAITITANTDTTGALWRPNAQIIPAADTLISDSEAAYLAMLGAGPANFRKFGAPDTIQTPTAGTWPMWPGQKLAFYDATLAVWKYLDIDNGAVRVT